MSALRVFAELYILTDGTGGVGGADVSVVMLIQMYARGFSGNLGYARRSRCCCSSSRSGRCCSSRGSTGGGTDVGHDMLMLRHDGQPLREGAGTSRTGMRVRDAANREVVLRYTLLVLVLFLTVGPFLWQLSTSLKGAGEDIYTANPSFLPS